MSRFDFWGQPFAWRATACAALALVACCALLSGCAAPLAAPFYVSSRFSQLDNQQIAQAARSWEVATLGAKHFDLVFNADVEPSIGSAWGRRIIVPVTEQEWEASDLQLEEISVARTVQSKSYMAIVLIPQSVYTLGEVVMHEFGHTMGMQHVADRDALMFEKPDPHADRFVTGQCLCFADAAELRAHVEEVGSVRSCR